jgi:molybdopterin-guanine dinucleotide biosynthesis protein A
MTIPALILAGGKSRRLGRDKVSQTVGGASLLERTASLAGLLCGEVWVSGRDPRELGLDLPWLPDDVPGAGPMGGVTTGLTRLGGPLLALACDLPLLDAPVLAALLYRRETRPPEAAMTAYAQAETGYVESLVAIYEPHALPLLRGAMRRGDYKLTSAVPPHLRCCLPYTRDQARAFFNVNRPEDLAALRDYLGTADVGQAVR